MRGTLTREPFTSIGMTFMHVLPSFVLTHSKHHRNVDEERIASNLLFCLGRSFPESVSDVTFLFCFGPFGWPRRWRPKIWLDLGVRRLRHNLHGRNSGLQTFKRQAWSAESLVTVCARAYITCSSDMWVDSHFNFTRACRISAWRCVLCYRKSLLPTDIRYMLLRIFN